MLHQQRPQPGERAGGELAVGVSIDGAAGGLSRKQYVEHLLVDLLDRSHYTLVGAGFGENHGLAQRPKDIMKRHRTELGVPCLGVI